MMLLQRGQKELRTGKIDLQERHHIRFLNRRVFAVLEMEMGMKIAMLVVA